MPEAKKEYRLWPKKTDGIREYIDKDKVKAEYMESRAFDWKTFCRQHGYNPDNNNRRQFPVRLWKEEKLQHQVEIGDETLTKQAYAARLDILKKRISAPKKWYGEGENTLQLIRAYERARALDAQWDSRHEEEIDSGLVKRRYTLKASELNQLAQAKLNLAELERHALLVNPADAYRVSIPIKDTDPEIANAESEGDRLRDMGVTVIGQRTAVSHDDMTQMLNKWIDQQATPVEATVETSPNEAVTPLEDDDETE